MQLTPVFCQEAPRTHECQTFLIVQDAAVSQSPALLQIFININSQKQFSRKKKNVNTTYSGELRKPAPKFVLILVKKQQKWSYGYGVDLRKKKKSVIYWFRFV